MQNIQPAPLSRISAGRSVALSVAAIWLGLATTALATNAPNHTPDQSASHAHSPGALAQAATATAPQPEHTMPDSRWPGTSQ